MGLSFEDFSWQLLLLLEPLISTVLLSNWDALLSTLLRLLLYCDRSFFETWFDARFWLLKNSFDNLRIVCALYALVRRFDYHWTVFLGEIAAKLLLWIHALFLLLADKVVGLTAGLMIIIFTASNTLCSTIVGHMYAIVVRLLLITWGSTSRWNLSVILSTVLIWSLVDNILLADHTARKPFLIRRRNFIS